MVGVLWQDLASMLDSGALVDRFIDSQLSGLHRYYEVSVYHNNIYTVAVSLSRIGMYV